jgi:hypothetical protein
MSSLGSHYGEQLLQEQEACDSGEEDEGHADAGLAVYFRDQVSGGYVECDTG